MTRAFRSVCLGTSALALILGVASVDAGVAFAQGADGVEEITVSATRRDQTLQDVPIAVSAFTGDDLNRQNIVSTQDLQRVAPSLVISSSNTETGGSTARIRGVGTTGNNAGLEGAVGIFIDGVYRQRAGLALNDLFDIGRVEVLRGPQGTLFGKNTSAGALTITPNLPDLTGFSAEVEAGYGDYDDTNLKGMINMPIVENKSGIRVAGVYHTTDGIVDDLKQNQDVNNRDRQLMRGMFFMRPTDIIDWRLTVDWSQKDERCCATPYQTLGPTAGAVAALGGVVIPTDPFDYQVQTNFVPSEQTEELGLSSHLDVDFDFGTLKTIIAHRTFKSDLTNDVDFGPADILAQTVASENQLTSFEATLNGSMGIVDWLVGTYLFEESIDQYNSTTYGTQVNAYVDLLTGGAVPAAANLYPAGGGNIYNDFDQESSGWSIFTHNVIDLTETVSATVGLRYNKEEKEGSGTNFDVNSPSCAAAVPASLKTLCPRPDYFSTVDEEEVTGTFVLSWAVLDNLNTYASYSRGYKAGGINLDRDATLGPVLADGTVVGTQAEINAAGAFKPEFSDSYEIGVKAEFFNRKVVVNTAAFFTEYEDFQLNTFNGLGFIVANAGSVDSMGVEVEGQIAPTESLFFTVGGAWVEAEYGDDPGLVAAGLAGRTLTNAPKWSGTASATYEHPIVNTGLLGFVNVNTAYRSQYNTGSNLAPSKIQSSFALWGGRIGVAAEDGAWEAYLWGTNLLDQGYDNIAFDSVFQSGSISTNVGRPREWGGTIKVRF